MAKGSTRGVKQYTRRNSAIALVAIVLLIAATTYVALNGFGQGFMVKYMVPWGSAIKQGLDLRGGVYTVYQAEAPEEDAGNFGELLNNTIRVLQDRLTNQGFTEATVVKQGEDRIRVEIPDVQDPNQVLEIIGTPAHLEFKDPEGNVVMEGKHVKTALAKVSYDGTAKAVELTLTPEGKELFAKATAANVGRNISIELDGEVISNPTVNQAIPNGQCVIEGQASDEESERLAVLIQSGALPLQIKQLEMSAISATLGVEALDRALLAGVIGMALVMLFMLVRYRLPGLAADIALVVYVLLVVFLLAVFGAQLTLPGIAGIVLGIGMAVDANVIIFERFREEMRGGRALRVALKLGFHNALSAIMDSNVTTIIAALVLLQFGTGSVRGFAMTLLIGVVTSLCTAVFVTRSLLKLFINLGAKNTKLFVG